MEGHELDSTGSGQGQVARSCKKGTEVWVPSNRVS